MTGKAARDGEKNGGPLECIRIQQTSTTKKGRVPKQSKSQLSRTVTTTLEAILSKNQAVIHADRHLQACHLEAEDPPEDTVAPDSAGGTRVASSRLRSCSPLLLLLQSVGHDFLLALDEL